MRWPAQLSRAEKIRVVLNSVRFMGPLATVKGAIAYAVVDRPDRDRAFDRRYGTDTAGELQPEELGIEDADAREAAVRYLPSPARITRRMLDALEIDPATWAFVDYGCGKGRVLMVAAEQGFRSVLGVEISRPLHAIATQNAERFAERRPGHAPIEVVRADARTVPLRELDTVFHFYHPFGPSVLRDVIAHIGSSLERSPREIRIAYLAAFQDALDVLDSAPFLTCTRFVRCIDPKYSWALFRNV